MNNIITIDEGEQSIKGGKVVIKRRFTLSEEGDYETGTIKYHELFYDIDKSISVPSIVMLSVTNPPSAVIKSILLRYLLLQ